MKKNLEPALKDIVSAIALKIKEIKSSVGNLNDLQTISKTDVVSAINELRQNLNQVRNPIDNTITSGTTTWSSSKILSELDNLRNSIQSSSDFTVKLTELENKLTGYLNRYVRHDISTNLSDSAKKIARDNIGALDRSLKEVTNLSPDFISTVKSSMGYKSITSVNITGDAVKTLTLTFSDSSTLTSTFNDINIDPTKFNSLSFDITTGILKAVNGQGQATNVVLDGRYVLISTLDNYVKKDDSRLTDDRNAKDVHSWAKSPTKPEYVWTEIKDKPELVKFGTSNEKGNLKISSDNEIQIYDGTKWITASANSSSLVHIITSANKTQSLPSKANTFIVRTGVDLTSINSDNNVWKFYKDTSERVTINGVTLDAGHATLIGTAVTLSHPDFDFLNYFNTIYNS